MNAKKAHRVIDQVCRELDIRQHVLHESIFSKYVRPIGFGVILGLTVGGALAGCVYDDHPVYGIPHKNIQLDGSLDGNRSDTFWPDRANPKDMNGEADSSLTDTTPWPDMVEPKDPDK